jgi:hypothetical protein
VGALVSGLFVGLKTPEMGWRVCAWLLKFIVCWLVSWIVVVDEIVGVGVIVNGNKKVLLCGMLKAFMDEKRQTIVASDSFTTWIH